MTDPNANTARSFRDKWDNNPTLAFAESLRPGSEILTWILRRNGFNAAEDLQQHLVDRRRILDAGCGNGRVTALLRTLAHPAAEVFGIDLVSADVAAKNLSEYRGITVRQADLLGNLEGLGSFDFIYCQEVLHHTANPQQAFRNLCALLDADGEIAIYVYKKKAPAREFVDELVRERISPMPYDEALAACKEITEFGRALAETNTLVRVPSVKVLEIEGGEYDVQRLIYHFFFKCFWNADLSFAENAAINYDWYHPQLSSHHNSQEITGWFEDAGLALVHLNVDHYGITARGIRRAAPRHSR